MLSRQQLLDLSYTVAVNFEPVVRKKVESYCKHESVDPHPWPTQVAFDETLNNFVVVARWYKSDFPDRYVVEQKYRCYPDGRTKTLALVRRAL